MKFELHKRVQSYTDADILEDIRRLFKEMGVDYLPLSTYRKRGRDLQFELIPGQFADACGDTGARRR